MSRNRQLNVLILNDSPDVLNVLQQWFSASGHHTAVAQLSAMPTDAAVTLTAVVEQLQPHVAIYDVGVPYLSNWDLLKALRVSGVFDGIPIVITTSNKAVLDRLVGPSDALELIGLRTDLDAIVKAAELAALERNKPKRA